MPRLLNIVSSPRGDRSVSTALAAAYIEAFTASHAETEVDTLDVWHTELPPFDGPALEAKYAGLTGTPLTPEQQKAWDAIGVLAKRFHAADHILVDVPMWNFGIPYRLKHLIDLVSQKDVLFRFDDTGFGGMLDGRKGVLFCARGISYGPGNATGTSEADYDFQTSYMTMWLRFVGITEIETVVVEKSLVGGESYETSKAKGLDRAAELGRSA